MRYQLLALRVDFVERGLGGEAEEDRSSHERLVQDQRRAVDVVPWDLGSG